MAENAAEVARIFPAIVGQRADEEPAPLTRCGFFVAHFPETSMKKIVLLVAKEIPDFGELKKGEIRQTARNYAGAVVEVPVDFADEAIALGEAKEYVEPTPAPVPEAATDHPPVSAASAASDSEAAASESDEWRR